MQPPPLTLNSLFAPQIQFVVPLFQRPYVWNKDDNWEPLWRDTRRIADNIVAAQPVRSHFLGQIVLQVMPTPIPMGVTRREVIDGQQRLTTLQVMIRAALDALQAANAGDVKSLIAPLTRNLVLQGAQADLVFKVWPTNADRESFRDVMLAGNNENPSVAPIGKAYRYFRDKIVEWLHEGQAPAGARISAIVDALQNRLLLIPIELDANDEAQVIFETLNGRGTPLLASDLIKNWLLRQIERHSGSAGVETEYEKYWRTFDSDQAYWRAPVGRGHAARPRLDTLLQHYLTARVGTEVAAGHLFTDFLDRMQKENAPSASTTMADISTVATLYRSFTPQHPDNTPARFFGWANSLELGTAAPFLIRLFEVCEGTPSARDAILADIESFVVRRMVCRLNTRGYNNVFLRLLNSIGNSATDAPEKVRQALLRGTSSMDVWPSDKAFGDELLRRPIYSNLSSSRVNALLRALEIGVRTKYMPEISVPASLWIEHIMPREWREHWSLPDIPLPSADDDSDSPEEYRDRLVNTLGNLTLVTAPLNQKMSNAEWEKKRPAIAEHGQLIVMNQKIVHQENWTEESILKRGELLVSVACQLWPYPAEAASQVAQEQALLKADTYDSKARALYPIWTIGTPVAESNVRRDSKRYAWIAAMQSVSNYAEARKLAVICDGQQIEGITGSHVKWALDHGYLIPSAQ